jgi:signal peptidase I
MPGPGRFPSPSVGRGRGFGATFSTRPYTAGLVTAPSTRRPLGCLFEIVETLVLTLVIFLVIQNFVAQPYRVQQQSMEHTLEPDQYVLVDKLTPHFGTYNRGDIIVFKPPPGWVPEAPDTPFIKRIIGVGGDTVEVRDDGFVYVNGTKLVEPYLYAVGGVAQPTETVATWHVPDGELFVMGDHREASADSRAFGTVPVSSVIGRAWLRYWPFDVFSILNNPGHPELVSPSP